MNCWRKLNKEEYIELLKRQPKLTDWQIKPASVSYSAPVEETKPAAVIPPKSPSLPTIVETAEVPQSVSIPTTASHSVSSFVGSINSNTLSSTTSETMSTFHNTSV